MNKLPLYLIHPIPNIGENIHNLNNCFLNSFPTWVFNDFYYYYSMQHTPIGQTYFCSALHMLRIFQKVYLLLTLKMFLFRATDKTVD